MRHKKDIIFGIRAIIEGINSDTQVNKVLIKKGSQGELTKELMDEIRKHQIPFQYVPVEKLNNITQKNHQGAIAFVSPVSYQRIEDIIPFLFEQGKNPLILVLDQLTDVRNFGAIARTAECAGVDAIVIPSYNSVQITPDAIKTSAGALHNIPVCRQNNLKGAVRFMKESGLKTVAATEKAEKLHHDDDLSSPLAIIMGSEDKGISNDLMKEADALIKIPIVGSIESLNVSVATAVITYEAVRQRSVE